MLLKSNLEQEKGRVIMFNPYCYETSDVILMPSFLFQESYRTKLKVIDKLIYTLYLDRYWLFEANDVIDSNGDVYFYFPDKELAELLNINLRTVKASKNRLKNYKFLDEVYCMDKNKLYLIPTLQSLEDSFNPAEEENSLQVYEEGD